MAEFVVNFDLLGGLTFDEWWETIDRMEEKELKKTRHAEKTEAEIEALAKARNEAGTIKQTMWAVRCFQSWCAEKAIEMDLKTVTKSDLNQTLRHFYATVKNGKGEPYGLSSYIGLRAALNRHLNDPPISKSWCLLNDSEFATSNNVFSGVIKQLRREGRDKTTHHQALSESDLAKIKHSDALNPNTPVGLVNKVWFDVQLHMGRRAKEGNRQLKPESFAIRVDENGLKYATLTFNECTKNHKDGTEVNKERLRGFMYQLPGNPLCPVASLEKYLSLLQPNPPAFYLHTKRTNYAADVVW